MKLFSAFKTPAWEQRDPERRAIAVRDEAAPELLAKLPDIAANDAEPAVRRAALARLSVAEFLLQRHRSDPDADTRAAALSRLQRLLLDSKTGLAPGARLAALALDLPGDLLERVAESAPEVEARRAALARITRAGFLQRRCVDEADAALRAELLERIDGEDALDKLAEQLRKRDKTLSRRARERAEGLRLERGDAAATQRYADGLCEQLTRWAQQQPDDLVARLAQANAEWQARGIHADASLQIKVEAYFERVRDALARRDSRLREAEQEVVARADAVQAEAAQRVVDAATPPRIETDWSAFDNLLAEANRVTAAKQLGEARPALQRLHTAVPQLPKLSRERRERLAEIEIRVAELERWERWSGNRVRARLCEELEALIAAAPHPDAVAHRVRELQQEWAKIEAAEPGEADRNAGLARRFRALCARAIAPTRAYFEKRDELRGQRQDAIATLLAQVAPDALAPLSVPAQVGLRRQLVESLRSLDGLEPKARTRIARELREALSRIDTALDAQREDAALARRKLIAKLRRELTHADPATALSLAKQAQVDWKALPRAAREAEAALDQELRSLIDPLFANERSTREQASQEQERVQSESQRLLEELATLAQGDAEALAHADGRIAALSTQWRELHATAPREPERTRTPRASAPRGRESRRPPPTSRGNDAERRFDQAVAAVKQAQQALASKRRGTQLQALADVSRLLAATARGELDAASAEAQWLSLDLDDALRKRVHPRWAQAQESDRAADAQARARWLVEAELDLDLDSPAEAQALRRRVQMQRLASRLQGGATADAGAIERLIDWVLFEGAPDASDEARLGRIVAVLSKGTGTAAG